MWQRIREIIKKELIQTLRDPRMRTLLFVPPMVQLLVFGFAVNLDVDKSPLAWMDRDNTPASRELLHAFTSSGRFRLMATPARDEDAQDLLDQGVAATVVQIPPGFSEKIKKGKTAQIQIMVDGTNSNTASILADYGGRIVASYSSQKLADRQREMLVGPSMAAGGSISLPIPRLTVHSRVWFNEDLKSQNYFVPGVIVNIIALVTISLTALSIVREKEIGTMEQLLVTPIRPIELLLGKMLPFAMIGIFEVCFIVAAALLVFHIPFRGSLTELMLCALVFLVATLGMGLFISTISNTQQQAMMASFLYFTPSFMLSGFAFPIRNMPPAVQYLTCLNPIRYFMEITRGIFLKGIGLRILWPQLLALAILGSCILTLSVLRFHKRLD
jgi:ABC-2 type transport system permease protein